MGTPFYFLTCTSALPWAKGGGKPANWSRFSAIRPEGPKILLGDFNEWIKGKATRTLANNSSPWISAPF